MNSEKEVDTSVFIKLIDDKISQQHLRFFEKLILEKFVSLEKSMTLQLGCSTKYFTEEMLERIGKWSRIIIVEPNSTMIDNIRLHLGPKGSGKIFFKSDFDWNKLPFDDEVFHCIVSILFWQRSPNRLRMLSEMARLTAPSGVVLLSSYLNGSMHEFFDLYHEVITQFDLTSLAPTLQTVKNQFLTKKEFQQIVEESGFSVSKVTEHDTKLEFSNSREIFPNPLIQIYWKPVWDKIGGRESERIYWHIRKAMDSYFLDKKIPLTIKGCIITAIK